MAPTRRRTFALAGNFARRLQIGQQRANPFTAHAWAGAFDIGKLKAAELLAYGGDDKFRLCTPLGFDVSGALLEFGVATADDGKEQIHPRREFVTAFVPVLRASVEHFVIVFL